MAKSHQKNNSKPDVLQMIEEVLGCKWSLSILASIRHGVCRPGALAKKIEGLSTKVLNERLTKMVRFGILEKKTYPEIPPRVEYALTSFGRRLITILDSIEALQKETHPVPETAD